MKITLLVLNYNGRELLEECMTSIVDAANASRHETEVVVIDNDSTDDSVDWLCQTMPWLTIVPCSNQGLCSFNRVVAELDSEVVILLNNDIKMHRDSVDPMCDPLDSGDDCFMVAPKCLRFDNESYEGFRTAVWWKWGLLRATALFPGHEPYIDRPGESASVGAVMAVDRRRFVELGGFDPLYLPGRIEDLDLAFRAFLRGYTIRYEPSSLTWHRGMATFAKAFGSFGCDQLALRNTLLFQWKNLRTPCNLLRQFVGLPIRLIADWLRLPFQRRGERLPLTRAFLGALARLPQLFTHPGGCSLTRCHREREFFTRFSPKTLRSSARGEEKREEK